MLYTANSYIYGFSRTEVFMKILVYGAGVIGGCLAHCLCQTKNEITILARGNQKEVLERDGLVARNHFTKKVCVSRPHVIDTLLPEDTYDIIFAVMQYKQIEAILPALAANSSKTVVLVGNNMQADETEKKLSSMSANKKTILFGFQATGGERNEGHYTYVAFGKPGMSVGSSSPESEWLPLLQEAFEGTSYRLTPRRNMDTWFKSHSAFVLPVCYIIYKNNGSIHGINKSTIYKAIEASLEGTLLLKHLGYPVEQDDIDAYSTKKKVTYLFYWLCVHTKIGELAASNHANNAVNEMIDLHNSFTEIRSKALDFKMEAWKELEAYMPKSPEEWKMRNKQGTK